VATSILPKLVRENAGRRVDDDYQRLCIQSWLACGFRVISVNADDTARLLVCLTQGLRVVGKTGRKLEAAALIDIAMKMLA